MSIRRIALFLYFTVLLVLFVPKIVSTEQVYNQRPPKADLIQYDSFLGTFLSDRFVGDTILLTYLDAYGRVNITYGTDSSTNTVLQGLNKTDSPLGFCLVLDQIANGVYLEPQVDGWYDVSRVEKISMHALRVLKTPELNAISEYWKGKLQYNEGVLDADKLRATIDNRLGAIVLFEGYYPIYLYGYNEDTFYAYDPVINKQNVKVMLENQLVYRNGLITLIDGVQINA